jgi:transcriptional regulator with XRE-family HTH domain
MIEASLGQRLRELRDKADLSVRELAKRIGISSPFLSDIELGRRFPSEEILGKLAAALNVPLEYLKQYDNRAPIADLKRLMDSDPKLGLAFRTAVEKLKSGELTAEDLIARLSKPPRRKYHAQSSNTFRTIPLSVVLRRSWRNRRDLPGGSEDAITLAFQSSSNKDRAFC